MDFNDLKSLSKLNFIVQGLAIILIFLGGVLQASRFYLDKKINDIKSRAIEVEKGQAQQTIDDLQGMVSQQANKIDQQSKEIESERQKLQTVKSETKPRSIPQSALPTLRTELAKHQGETIEIICVMGDHESFSFASELKRLFESSGWLVDGVKQTISLRPIMGLILVIKDESAQPKAEYLFRVLKSVGFHSEGKLNQKAKGDLAIVVGAKK